jgi:ferredoxin
MPWIVTRLCRDCMDTACVSVCPVDSIYRYQGEDKRVFPNQLFINPDESIDCGACEPECPWQAIFEEAAVPDLFRDDVVLKYKMIEQQSESVVQKHEPKEPPMPEQVEANKTNWGLVL